MKKIFLAVSMISLIFGTIYAERTVGSCSAAISRAIGAGDCDTWGNCWGQIARKVGASPNCDSVGCTTCAVARKLASKELEGYAEMTVGNCAAALARHYGGNTGGVGTSVCSISDYAEKKKKLD